MHILPLRAAVLLALWRLAEAGLPRLLLAALLAADLLLLAWQFVHFQRSADSHVRHHGGMAPVWGGQLALLFAGFAAAALWWGAFLTSGRPGEPELFTDRMDRLHAAAYRLEASGGGQEIRFEGLITFGLTARLTALIEKTPEAAVLVLSGAGGHIYEARGAAQVILAHGLATRAEGACASACTLLFAAGRTRSMAPGAQLGFHGYGLESGGSLPHVDVAAEQEKDRAFFRRRGASDAFLARMFDAPQHQLWQLDAETARAAGLLAP